MCSVHVPGTTQTETEPAAPNLLIEVGAPWSHVLLGPVGLFAHHPTPPKSTHAKDAERQSLSLVHWMNHEEETGVQSSFVSQPVSTPPVMHTPWSQTEPLPHSVLLLHS
jgi:hypothetical protein